MQEEPCRRCRCLQEVPWKWQRCCCSSAVPVQVAWPCMQLCARRAAAVQQGWDWAAHCRHLSMLTRQHELHTALVQRAAMLSTGMWPPGGCRAPFQLASCPVSTWRGGVGQQTSSQLFCAVDLLPGGWELALLSVCGSGCAVLGQSCAVLHPAAQRSLCCFAVRSQRPRCRAWRPLSCVGTVAFPPGSACSSAGSPSASTPVHHRSPIPCFIYPQLLALCFSLPQTRGGSFLCTQTGSSGPTLTDLFLFPFADSLDAAKGSKLVSAD